MAGGAKAVNANSCGTSVDVMRQDHEYFVAVSHQADDAADEDGRSLLRTK